LRDKLDFIILFRVKEFFEAMKIRIRKMDFEKDMEQVFKLYGTVFGKESLNSWKKRWRWEYLENPSTEYIETIMWVAERADGTIVGVHGGYPERIKINENEISTVDPGDMAVYKEARRQGLGEKLTKEYMDNEKFITIAYNWAAATGRIFRRLGLVEVDCVLRYLRVNDLNSILYSLLASGRVPSWAGNKPLVYLFNFGCKALN
jgi:GNAT superfamily N-acetyltransferase